MFIRKQPSRVSRGLALWLIVSHLTSFVAPVLAGPEGGVVTHGSATISGNGAVTTINQSTDRAVVNWNSFSNAAHETVQFQQPGTRSITLNRVNGNAASQIDGALTANGRVFLLNPNGVVFGKTANVKVNGLVTSTLDMNDDEGFMRGSNTHSFSQNPARAQSAVVNHGRIEAGDGGVALVAPVVNNHGQIVAAVGHVSLAGTTQAVVNYDQQGLVNVAIPSGKGGRGDVTLPVGASSEVLEDAAVAPGIVEAGAIVRGPDGKITLKHAEGLVINQGSITARGANGNGGRVALHGTQGTILAKNSVIDASAVVRGKGGDVRVTSGGVAITQRSSKILVRGGDEGGDGGFVDISAPKFDIRGTADASAPRGQVGTLLLDPADIVITNQNGGNAACDCQLASCNAITGTTPADPSVISETVLEGLTGTILLCATNSILVQDLTTDGTLTLQNNASLVMQAGAGGVTFQNTNNSVLASGCGAIAIITAGAVNAGNLVTACGNISITAGTSISTGNLSAGGASTIDLFGPAGITTGSICAINLNLTTQGTATQNGAYNVANLTTLTASTAGNGTFNLHTQNNSFATVRSSNQVCTVRVRDDGGFSVGSISAQSTVELATDNTVSVATSLTTNDLRLTSTAGSTGTFCLTSCVSLSTIASTNTVDTVNLTTGSSVVVAGINAASQVTLNAAAGVTQTGAIVTPTLNLAGAPGTTMDLGTQANDVCCLNTTTALNVLSFRDDSGFTFNPNACGFASSLTISSSNAVNQTAAILTPCLTLSSNTAGNGTFNFDTQNNQLGTVQTVGQVDSVLVRDDAGFTTGAIQGAGAVTLITNGTVNQTGGITANSLTVDGTCGTFNLTATNDVNQLQSNNTQSRLSYNDVDGFDVAFAACGFSTAVALGAGGTVTESAPINTPCLTLGGSATYNLCTQNNDVGTLNTNTVTARLRDDTGFNLGCTNVSGTLEVRTCGTVNSTGATVGSLVLSSTSCGCGSFNFCTVTLADLSTGNQIDSASITAASPFAVGACGVNVANNLSITAGGTLTQAGAVTVSGNLSLTSSGCLAVQFDTQNNCVGSITTTNTLADLRYRDDNGFAVGALCTNALTLRSDSCVTQTTAISTGTLTLGGVGSFVLDTQDNAVTTLATTGCNPTLIRFRDDTGFDVAGIGAAAVVLQSNGVVTNSGTGVFTPCLTVQATCAGQGNFLLGSVSNNAGNLSWGAINGITFRDDNGFTITAAGAVTAGVTLDSNGAVTQAVAINAGALALRSSAGACANFQLGCQNNSVTIFSTQGCVGNAAYRNDASFVVGSTDVSGTLELITNNQVTQNNAINAGTLILTSQVGCTGDFQLASVGTNTIGNVRTSNTVFTVAVRSDGTTCVGNTTAVTQVDLVSTGTVNQSGVVTAPVLTVGGGGTFNLGCQNNVLCDVSTSSSVTTAIFRDDGGFNVAGVTATGSIGLITNGTVTQSGGITAGCLLLDAQSAGCGSFVLNSQANAIGTVNVPINQVNDVLLRDDSGFTVNNLRADTSIQLESIGTVTVGAAGVVTPCLKVESAICGQGTFDLIGANSDVACIRTNNQVASVTFRDDGGFNVVNLSATGAVSLQSNGTVNQTGAIVAGSLTVRSDGSNSGTWNLCTQVNEVASFGTAAQPNLVRFRDDTGFDVTGANVGTDLTLISDGTVTQSGAIAAQQVLLTPITAGQGAFNLGTQANTVCTVASTAAVNALAFRDDGGFTLTPGGAFGTSLALVSNGIVNTTAAITAPLFTVSATTAGSGTFNFGGQNQTIGTLATGNLVGALNVRDDASLTLGTASATNLTLRSCGTVDQTGVVTASNLSLDAGAAGVADVVLNTQNNAFGTVSTANTMNTLALRDDAGFTVGALTTDTSITLQSNGTVDQTAVIITPSLILCGTTAGQGVFALNTQNNAFCTVSTGNAVNTARLRNDANFALGTLSGSSVCLLTCGTISQTAPLSATTLSLVSNSAGAATFNLGTQNNTIGTLNAAGSAASLDVRADAGFTVGVVGATAVSLTSNGTVGESGSINAATLVVRGTTAGSGDFNLANDNAVGCVATGNVVNSLFIRDSVGFTVSTLTADTRIVLSSNGTVTQAGAASISTPGLELQGAPGFFNLVSNVDVDVLSANLNGGGLTIIDVDDLAIGTVLSSGIANPGGTMSLRAAGIAFNESANLGNGSANIVSTGNVTMAPGKLLTAFQATIDANVGNTIGTAANRFNTNLCQLAIPDTGLATSGGASAFLNEVDDVTISARLGQTFDAIAGGRMTLTSITAPTNVRAQAGTLALGSISTGTFELVSAASLVDLNGGDVNITASGNGRIAVTGASTTAGDVANPIDIVGGGTLTLNLRGQVGGVSGAFQGTLPAAAGSIILEAVTPGVVFFNGFPVGVSVAQAVTTALGQGAAGAILSTGGQLTDLVEVAADADGETPTQTDESEAERKKQAKARQALKKSQAGKAD